ARLRAVEEGLPVVRVANSGISAFIDAHGRVLSSLPLGAAGVLDGALPVALDPPPYARLGNVIPAMVGLMLIIIALFTTFRDSRRISGDRRKMERAAKYIKHINLAPKSHTYV
ncbi:MAG: hypothetical protein KDE22_08550, partial [Rhodobacterales bacterium]|nr:hypothetical protein [Rhodobacterales bacterium]